MPRVRLNDCDIHYEESGTGRPVVFIHGLWMSGRFFDRQLPYFSQRYRTIVLDLRGHGQSEKTAAGHTVAQHARDVRALLETLDLRDAVLAGWSMGSLVIWDYIEQFGVDRLAGMVDIDQSPSDFKWPDWPHGLLDLETLHQFHTGAQLDQRGTAEHFVPMLFAEPPAPEDAAWMVDEMLRLPPGIASAILFDQSVVDYRQTLPKVTIPALLCIGRVEGIVPVAAGEYMLEHMPDARLVVFEHSNHCPFLEETDRFNEVVDEFVASL